MNELQATTGLQPPMDKVTINTLELEERNDCVVLKHLWTEELKRVIDVALQ